MRYKSLRISRSKDPECRLKGNTEICCQIPDQAQFLHIHCHNDCFYDNMDSRLFHPSKISQCRIKRVASPRNPVVSLRSGSIETAFNGHGRAVSQQTQDLPTEERPIRINRSGKTLFMSVSIYILEIFSQGRLPSREDDLQTACVFQLPKD